MLSHMTYELENLQGTGAQSDVDVIAAVADKKIVLHWACISVSGNADVQLPAGADAAGTRIVDAYLFVAGNSQIVFNPQTAYQLPKETALKITTSAGNVKVSALYSTTTVPGG